HGDTAIVQYGIGTFGSRGLAVGGTAVYLAIQKLKDKAGKIAAHLLQCENASFIDGKFCADGKTKGSVPEPSTPVGQAPAGALPDPKSGGKTLTMMDIALEAHVAKNLPADMEPGLSATSFFEPKNFTFPFGTHIAVVEIDKETGEIDFQRYVAVDDCGKQINPMLVEGQIHGGIVQSLGQALYEELVYDENGQLVTGTLMDYALPKAIMIPHLELASTETPSPVNPLGAKGVGEAGTIGATPAIVSAIVDALAPYGVRHLDMPLKPEVLWKIINKSSEAQRKRNGTGWKPVPHEESYDPS
ncbi:MAG TPA: molybdopterin cofactor-binding domain-containing protein, partial [Verrucomicrobiae bacterium]|nr:molybdopterin cofactor-binding domain-containing protein [Verrucomicrobiae bacterium]